ncbi:MAG: glutamate-5-semialdehyde dehydrogenase [Gammaproteobacteria bacterium]|nr:glutamate-5-semialdehyde dehydrogenase [Gammaproteobacteria bacterium]MDH3846563.1 glutamate-5-semialdehyde dehydrogenase [Gammaproteobacteria bacterium]MDH3865155.1 glutamate-5-semialdehyde dehydrogenase [Gammaproteobacteria bacterium]MDH4004563.1 glutamate-5-semialdehyde dehydrogenase [Gammaproteobacteria bacterium]NCF60418.1 glutamate-5-semialdehyde dehydrogenase [Gammaproteobacteria bacterium]
MDGLGRQARDAARELSMSSGDARNSALHAASAELRSRHAEILDANAIDMREAGERGLSAAMLDRLMLDESRIEAMAAGLEAIAGLPDPLGRVMAEWQRPNGLNIQRVAVPLGVIGIIYESRPNVTADAAGLCVKSGNAVILRGGSESFHSSRAIHACLVSGLEKAGLPADCVQMVPTTDRAAVGYLLSSMAHWVDVVVPRGGKNLIRRVQEEARVPVIGHLEGICHVYLHEAADAAMAAEIAVNAKMRRTGICGAAETLLVDRGAAARLLPGVLTALRNAGCEIRGDSDVVEFFPEAKQASEDDWGTEYLDAILSVRVVDDIDAAIQHISEYGSGHTECIVTNDDGAAGKFFRNVDSAILLQNASTQFADGGEFGMGAEIGIATGRIHARGPVGAEQLTSYKYVVRGSGQTRP